MVAACYRRGTVGMRFAFCSDETLSCALWTPRLAYCSALWAADGRCGIWRPRSAARRRCSSAGIGKASRCRRLFCRCGVAARCIHMWALASSRRDVDKFMPAASSSVNLSDRRRDQGIRVCMPILTEHVVLILTPPSPPPPGAAFRCCRPSTGGEHEASLENRMSRTGWRTECRLDEPNGSVNKMSRKRGAERGVGSDAVEVSGHQRSP